MGAKPQLNVILCAPRGFCAGVDRAIQIVELALKKYGAPVYVRHEIVHNRFVVETLKAKGAIFVEELDEIPDGDAPVIFSAHGVPKSVPDEAARRNMFFLDATCPLVWKVHKEAERHHRDGREVVLIGHRDHPEVVGTMGQLPVGAVTLVETAEDARWFEPGDAANLAYSTQTTLSVDDTGEIIAILVERFPAIVGPRRDDICYATTNRQDAVKQIAQRCDALFVVGAPNSSNSQRLVEVARRAGCANARLIENAGDLDWPMIETIATLGLTAGASAPEILIDEIVESLGEHFALSCETVTAASESLTFKLPRELQPAMAD